MLPTVSLIIPARNEEKVIKTCLESICGIDYPKDKLEIVVAVNNSDDRTEEIAREFEPDVNVVVADSMKNPCKAGALNFVLPMLKGEIVGIYDADCIVEKNCVRNAVKHFSDEKVSGVTGVIKSYNKTKNLLTRLLSIETTFSSYIEYFLNKHGANAHFVGKNMFIRKKVLEEINGFDTYAFQEDAEISLRMKRLGYRVKFAEDSITWHEEPEDIRSFLKQRVRWARGSIRIKRKSPYKFKRDVLADIIHMFHYYTSPFGLLLGIGLFAAYFVLNIPLIFLSPFILIFIFNMYLLVKSRLVFKEPLRYLLLYPLLLIIGNLHIPILLKAWYDEKTKKRVSWFKADRSGVVS